MHVWSIDEIVGLWECGIVRYARPSCDERIRLAADTAAVYQEYLAAKDALTLTPKESRDHPERRKHLDRVRGQLGEARKREDFHESTHQDEFSK
jgi:hypothetical protein